MARGPLFQNDYQPQFSGHETFPLRYGWLKKVHDCVRHTEHLEQNRSACWGEDAIARFGVGKNMVASMRHWAGVTDVITETNRANNIKTTEFGRFLFDDDGVDPYMENPSTLWLIHWKLAGRPEKTTWFWAFNYYPTLTFERDHLIKRIQRLAAERNWSRIANTTVQNDVACFVRTYAPQQASKHHAHDDVLESSLIELGLIKRVGKRDGYRFVRGPKSSLGHGAFVYALLDFWSRHSKAATLSFEALAHEPGAPGRVFLLDEDDLIDRLTVLEDVTGGALRWSETAGLKQVVREAGLEELDVLSILDRDYSPTTQRKVV